MKQHLRYGVVAGAAALSLVVFISSREPARAQGQSGKGFDAPIVFQGAGPEVFDYYAARQGVLTDIPRLWIRTNARPLIVDADQVLAGALAERPQTARFWLIQFGDSGDPDLNRFVRQRFSQSDDLSVAGIRVRMFQVRR